MAETDSGDQFFIDVDALLEQGITAQDIAKLKGAGIATITAVIQSTKKNLTKIKGLSEIKVDKIKECASKIMPDKFITGVEAAEKRTKVFNITTGSKSFDAMLGGGVQTQSITEVYGEFRTGKTQLCHSLCVSTQLPVSMGGGEGKVAYIDTENTFRPDRIRSIADRFGVDADAALGNILVGRAHNSEHQMDLINFLAARMAEEGGSIRLLIVDSIMALFRVDYSGRGELSERQQKLNQMLSRLTRLSEEYNVAVLLTNQVQADPSGGMMFAANDKKPLGGHVMAHSSTTRVYLRKGRGEERVAKLADSPDMPESEATYTIKVGGIEDA